MWIIHEAEKQTWCWLSTKGQLVLPPEKDPYQVCGLPLDLLIFNKGLRSIWGAPDAKIIETQQREGDESRRDGRLQSRAANIKAFYDDELLDEDAIQQYLTTEAMGCIPVSVPTDKKLGDVILLVQPHVQMERFEYQKHLFLDAQHELGYGPNQLGNFAPGRRTAREVQTVETHSQLRSDARRTKLAGLIGKAFTKLNTYLSMYWTTPQVHQIVGLDGAIYWVQANAADFNQAPDQLYTKVNVESLTPVSRETRRREMAEVMSLLAKFAPLVGGANILPILQNFLSQFDWADVTRILPSGNPKGSPMGREEFAAHQQGALSQGNLGNTLQTNLSGLGSLINQMPRGGK